MKGLVFAIEEMAVHDGPGLRTTVFLKGCPLRCQWCHNPEGWEPRPQRVRNPNGCTGCGACRTECETACTGCGRCLSRCPRGLLRISGKWWDADALARRVLAAEPFLRDGGVTVSGGEPLMQPEFLCELLDCLRPLHRALETSAFCAPDAWREALKHVELVYIDLKLADPAAHRRYTGVSNEPILQNLAHLKTSGVPFLVRIPTIQNVNDDPANMEATCRLLSGSKNLRGVELLPYNPCAGAKYALLGKPYPYSFSRPTPSALETARSIFSRAGIPALIR